MATDAQLITQIQTLLADNNNGDISELDARTVLENIVNSKVNRFEPPFLLWSGIVNNGVLVRQIYKNPSVTSVAVSNPSHTRSKITFTNNVIDYSNKIFFNACVSDIGFGLSDVLNAENEIITDGVIVSHGSNDLSTGLHVSRNTMVTIYYNGTL